MSKRIKLKTEMLLRRIDSVLNQSNIPFFKESVFDERDRLHILYVTINKKNHKPYVGIHTTSKIYDSYIGCGIKSNRNSQFYSTRVGMRRSPFFVAVCKYGVEFFERKDVAYFNTRKDALLVEKMIVNREYINDKDNYNAVVGGSAPPVNYGQKNGNYGNFWSAEKKRDLSNHFLKNRNTKGHRNNRAIQCVLIDVRTQEKEFFQCGKYAADKLGLKNQTVLKYMDTPHLMRTHFLAIRVDLFDKMNERQVLKLINKAKKNSRWYKLKA